MPKTSIYACNSQDIRVEVCWRGSGPSIEGVEVATTIKRPGKDDGAPDSPPTPDEFIGSHASLDRDGINLLIRTLRRARDAAYGADA